MKSLFTEIRRQQTLTYKFSFSIGGVYCMLWKLSDVFFFIFLVSTVQPKFRVYGTSISGFKATRLKINNSGDQPVRVVDNQESPVLYSYCNDFVQTKSRSRVVVYISPKYMLLTFSLLSFSYGPIHFPILIQ